MRAKPRWVIAQAPPIPRAAPPAFNVAPRIPARKELRNGRSAEVGLYCTACPLPGGVIGSTPDSGSGSWGSSPCPAVRLTTYGSDDRSALQRARRDRERRDRVRRGGAGGRRQRERDPLPAAAARHAAVGPEARRRRRAAARRRRDRRPGPARAAV